MAVIEVVGRTAPAVVAPLLRTSHELDLQNLDSEALRFCRWADGDQTIDDALVTVRRQTNGIFVIDISLHGGPRIVQRSLLMLKRAGAVIVAAEDLLETAWPVSSAIERELLPLLLRAQTRAVAVWLGQAVQRLPGTIQVILQHLAAADANTARRMLTDLRAAADKTRFLLKGVRVVLVGGPNTGKSTLANALAGREQAIVSEMPGTTRDWVDHPGAIDGVPFIFVDTAGIRDTKDPIEREAIRHTHDQVRKADVVLEVIDRSAPLVEHRPARERSPSSVAASAVSPSLTALSKADLPLHPRLSSVLSKAARTVAVEVSAKTGAGLDDLRRKLLSTAGLTDWRQNLPLLVTERQRDGCRTALSALETGSSGLRAAAAILKEMVSRAEE